MSNDWSKQIVHQHTGWLARVRHSFTPTQNAFSPSGLDQLLAQASSTFKHDKTTTVAKVMLSDQSAVLKRYNPRSAWHSVSRSLRQTRARRCWNMSYAFHQAGLKVAKPILMLEQRFGPIRLDAYFANELLEGQELLKALPNMQPDEQQQVLVAIKEAFKQMQDAMLTHGDMKASNLIWSGTELYFIDLDASQQHRSKVSWNASHQRDRARFIKNWHDQVELMALFSDI